MQPQFHNLELYEHCTFYVPIKNLKNNECFVLIINTFDKTVCSEKFCEHIGKFSECDFSLLKNINL